MEQRLPSKYVLFPGDLVINFTKDASGFYELCSMELTDVIISDITEVRFNEPDDEFSLVYNDIRFVYDRNTEQFVAVAKAYKPRTGAGTWEFTRSHDLNNFTMRQGAEGLRHFEYWVSAGEAYRTIDDNPEEYRDYADDWVLAPTEDAFGNNCYEDAEG